MIVLVFRVMVGVDCLLGLLVWVVDLIVWIGIADVCYCGVVC